MTTFVARTSRDLVTVSGPDAATYLQGQLTQDVAALPVGGGAWSFVLAPQGKVEGWGRVHRTADDTFEIDVDPGAAPAWEARLRRFLLRTKADIAVATDVAAVAVRGAGAAALVGADDGWLPAGWPGTEGLDRLATTGGPDELVAAVVAAGAVEVGPDAYEALRIRAGVPRWGAELDLATIPATVGQWAIDGSVSFTKGCYTGQELVARIDSRGGNVPRHLCGLVVDGPPPAPGAEAVLDGAPVGTVTSSAPDPTAGGAVALVFVPRSVEVPDVGTAVTVDGRPARLVPLPIPSS